MTDQKPRHVPEWMQDAIRAEPRGFMDDVIRTSRLRSNSASLIPDKQRSEDKPRPVSGGSTELKPVPGIDHMDRIAAGFAHQDKMQAVKVKVETDWLEFQLEQAKESAIETDYSPFDRENMKR